MIAITINGESWAGMGQGWAGIKIIANMLKMN